MAFFRYALGRPFESSSTLAADFTPVAAVTQGTQQTGWEATNVRTEHIKQAWRSVDATAANYISLDLSATTSLQNPDAILVEGLNVASIRIRNRTLSDLGAGFDNEQTITVSQNRSNDRYSALWINPNTGTWVDNKRYWGIYIGASETTTDSAAYYSCGRITVIKTLRTMVQNWEVPYGVESVSKGEHKELLGGQVESFDTSDRYAIIDLKGRFDRSLGDTITADIERLQRMTFTDRMLHFENRSDDTNKANAFLCARLGKMSVREQRWPILSADLSLRETI